MENKQELLMMLKNGKPEIIQLAIQKLKDEGDTTIVPELLEILLHAHEPHLITPITILLSDIKDISFKPLLMEKLIEADKQLERANLLRVCWESSLDFSDYLEIFVDFLMEENFIIALEASTVIENLHGKIPKEVIQQSIHRLQARGEEQSFPVDDTLRYLESLLDDQEEEEHDW